MPLHRQATPTVESVYACPVVQGGRAAPPRRVARFRHQGPGDCPAPALCEPERGRSRAHVHSWRPPPPPAHSWDVGRGPEGSVGSGRWTRPPRPPPLLSTRASSCPRRLPWPCAPRAAAACGRSCCASPGGPWRWSPRSKGQAVQAAACASVPPCAACICCWRPCPPWRHRPPSCECGPGALGSADVRFRGIEGRA